MTNPKPYSTDIVKDPGPWQITEEQIHEIKKGNPLVMNKFYLDNYGKLKAIASSFARTCGSKYGSVFGDTDGILSQFYLDLPFFDYSSMDTLAKSLKRCAFNSQFGGYKSQTSWQRGCISIDAQLTEDDFSLANILTDGRTPHDDLFLSDLLDENDKIVLAFVEENFLDPEERNLIFCYCFTDLRRKEIQGDEYESFKRYSESYCRTK